MWDTVVDYLIIKSRVVIPMLCGLSVLLGASLISKCMCDTVADYHIIKSRNLILVLFGLSVLLRVIFVSKCIRATVALLYYFTVIIINILILIIIIIFIISSFKTLASINMLYFKKNIKLRNKNYGSSYKITEPGGGPLNILMISFVLFLYYNLYHSISNYTLQQTWRLREIICESIAVLSLSNSALITNILLSDDSYSWRANKILVWK